MSVVEFKDVTRRYGRKTVALSGINFSLAQGTVCGLVGRNGAGKTTMLRMIPALLHPTAGTVRVFGLDPWQAQEQVKRQLGYLSENEVFPPRVRIRDVTDLCASVYPGWDAGMAAELMGQFGLEPTRRLGRLSKGQKRQVGLLCAVCHKPRLLVLDEPAGGLDPVARREFLEVVIELLAAAGSTVLFSSHILSDVDRIADRLAILHEGRLLLDRPVDQLKENICRVELGEDLPPGTDAALAAHRDCLRAEQDNGRVKATLLCGPDGAADLLRSALPQLPAARVMSTVVLSLEDIFIELTGGKA